MNISVVIITLNEENNIAECIRSAMLLSDDIIVVDCGSNDNTVNIAKQKGASVFVIDRKSYGFSRNFGAGKAKNEWVLALDADERLSPDFVSSVKQIKFTEFNRIYKFKRINYIETKKIKFGTPGFETVKRIYNRNFAEWDLSLVHEKLVANRPVLKLISGHLTHFGLKNFEDYKTKAVFYAQLSAEKYFLDGKRTNLLKRFFSALFNSLKSYIFLLGFLDGHQGFIIARTIAYYSWLKYFYLQQLTCKRKINDTIFPSISKIEAATN